LEDQVDAAGVESKGCGVAVELATDTAFIVHYRPDHADITGVPAIVAQAAGYDWSDHRSGVIVNQQGEALRGGKVVSVHCRGGKLEAADRRGRT